MSDGLSSNEAARILGVSKQTLYAYVSRGLIPTLTDGTSRISLYPRHIVEALAETRRIGRRPKEIAKKTIDWGLPVLETAISTIENEKLIYRTVDAVEFSSNASVEDVACLLWGVEKQVAFPELDDAAHTKERLAPQNLNNLDLLARFAAITADDETAAWDSPERQTRGYGRLLRQIASCITGLHQDAGPIHIHCARAWSLNDDETDILRQALVLCAEHELNVSSFTARCIASSGASIRAAVIGGLAALSGGRHGGMTLRVENMWSIISESETVSMGIRNLLASGDELPGFGHPLYPNGDVRAKALVKRIASRMPVAMEIIEIAHGMSGRHPSLDFALVALRRALRLPKGSAYNIFALGRTIGWIAQAIEQRESQTLIRPRATFTSEIMPPSNYSASKP